MKEQYRPDGSCYHVVDYSMKDGSVRNRHTTQGYAHEWRGAVDKLGYLRSDAVLSRNFLLMHCVGSIPHNGEIDVPLNYADYYFLEALKRKRDIEQKGSKGC